MDNNNIPSKMISEEKCWKLLENYFKEYGFITHQIESFDVFIKEGLQKIIEDEAEITYTKEIGDSNRLYYKIKFEGIYVAKPMIMEDDRKVHEILPMECRRRDLTYDSPIYVDINEYFEYKKQTKEFKNTIKTHKRIIIGRIPIMLRSSNCYLSYMTPEERIKAGECENDHGGYFIIRGKERVVISQVRNIYNKILVQKKKPNNKYAYIAETRSMSDVTGHSVLFQAIMGHNGRTMGFSMSYISELIPFGVVFKALGFLDSREILDFIGFSDEDISKNSKLDELLKFIIRDSYFIQTEKEAISYISKFTMHKNLKDSEKLSYAKQVIEREIFPHLGIYISKKERAYFLGNIIKKLLSTCIGNRTEDDIDNYCNKRVEPPGVLCYDLFKKLFKKFIGTLKTFLEKPKSMRVGVLSIISGLNGITNGIRYSFSTGKWGIQNNSYIKKGVVQILSRLSYGATLSHLRRVMLQIGKEGKNSKIRQINPSQIMFLCPAETPEGQPVGTVLNLSLLTKISLGSSPEIVRNKVERYKHIVLLENYIGIAKGFKVFINGRLIGFVNNEHIDDFNDYIFTYKELGYFHNEVSISKNTYDREINIYTDEGRLIRPLFKLTDNKPLITDEDTMDWNTNVDNGVIVYADNTEVEDSVIAFSEDDLKRNYKNNYLEISPAMMLGVMASIIPFPDHSQSPRNCYQSAMGKQAIGMYALNNQLRTDTITYTMDYPQKPLVYTKPSELMGFNDMPSGINAVVAILCYTGFNQEDSIIMNQSSIERGMFGAQSIKTHVCEEKKQNSNVDLKICNPKIEHRKRELNYNHIDDKGLAIVGATVSCGDVIVGRVTVNINNSDNTETVSDSSIVVKKGEEGYISRVITSINPDGYRIVKIVIINNRIPEVGDKFASRAAQKGTIGIVYPQHDMPFTSEGITPDIIMNPHAIPSRMTINQLMECVLAKGCCLDGTYGDSTAFGKTTSDIICSKLEKNGFQSRGYETMYNGMTGEMLKAKIFIGPTYYQRLKHMVVDKIHARANGPKTTLTRQPLEGRSRDGGLRFGEMERDCMIAHGASRFLKERLFDQSDPYQVVICDICGNFATTTNSCTACKKDKVTRVNMPYASKLLIQELNAMGIKTVMRAMDND